MAQANEPFEYRTPKLSGIQMNLVFGCPVFGYLLYLFYFQARRDQGRPLPMWFWSQKWGHQFKRHSTLLSSKWES